MKTPSIVLSYILTVFVYCINDIDASYDFPDNYLSSVETATPKNHSVPKCTNMKFYCESCSNLVMCIDTEYGYTKQYVTCPKGTTCLRGKCTEERNPLCDGTASIHFKCHVPGVFPDPFDCKKFHFCVPKSTKMVNGILKLKHFEHSCQEDKGVEYSYDPKSRYCKFEIENGCQRWPVPLCQHEAQTDALEENKSIFYVCDLVDGHLYPYLYACPHGEEYNRESTKCERSRQIDYIPQNHDEHTVDTPWIQEKEVDTTTTETESIYLESYYYDRQYI